MKIKKVLAALLAATVMISVAACSSGSSGSAESGSGAPSPTEGSSTASAGKTKGEFPTGNVTILVGFSAGSTTDLGARYMATSLSDILGVPVMVENVPGSGGWLAWKQMIHNTEPNGYTIGVINHNFAMGAYDDATPREETLADVQLLANQVIDYNVLAIRTDETRFNDLASFIEYSKNNDVLVTAQTIGITDGDSTCVQWFANQFGSQMTVVPVDAASDGRTMFVAGDVDVYFTTISDAYTAYQAGEMNVLCQFTEERTDWMPDVPTMKELDLGDYYVGFSARGYFYPLGVDPAIVDTVQQAMMTVMQDEAHVESLRKLGLSVAPLEGQEFYDLLNSQLEVRKKVWNIA